MKSISLAMLLVGTIIGAGFASGREIVSFFSSDIPLYIVPLTGAGIFLCSVLFLSIGNRIKAPSLSMVNRNIMGKAHYLADGFLLFNSLVVLAGMLSGMDSLFSLVLPIAPAYSIISGILCAILVSRGLKGLLKGNLLIVPIIILTIVLICSFSISNPGFSLSFRAFDIPAVITYVSMNMMLASTIFTSINGLKKSEIIISSAIAATIISALMLLIVLALNSNDTSTAAMPLMQMALNQSKPLFYVSLLCISVSIFTTMMTAMAGLNNWVSGFAGKGKYSIIIVLLAGLIVSNLGFENVVGYLYPAIGIFGILYILLSIFYIIRTSPKRLFRKELSRN